MDKNSLMAKAETNGDDTSFNYHGLNSFEEFHGNGQQITDSLSGSPEPLAICGFAMRLPGGVKTAEQFWELLIEKRDTRKRIPADRFPVESFQRSGKAMPEYGHFLDDIDLGCFDTSFFPTNRDELGKMDPQQRRLLEVVRECLENSNETKWQGKRIGCYVGTFGDDWIETRCKDSQEHNRHIMREGDDFFMSNRISYEFDFMGPSMTIKSACSSSLVCVNEACQALYRRDCSSAIVCGANLLLTPSTFAEMSNAGVLAPDGSCKTFDSQANGYARAEAINAVYVKPLEDALKDGNPVRAIIRATTANFDGKKTNKYAPKKEAHEALMRRAYELAHVNPTETAFVECHGTGTMVGDPAETGAVANVHQPAGVFICAVKPNMGHSEGAAGLTSVIKTVLALEQQIVPPNIKFFSPNPHIPFETGKLRVPTEATEFPKDRKERAIVNAFGVGGSNACVILESPASFFEEAAKIPARSIPALQMRYHCNGDTGMKMMATKEKPLTNGQLLLFSASHPNSLSRLIAHYQDYVKRYPGRIADLAYTLSCRREHLSNRAFWVTTGEGNGVVSPPGKVTLIPKIVMVFTGQGAQWPGMGRELIEHNETFRNMIRHLDEILSGLSDHPSWRIEEELLKSAKTSQIHNAEFSQPLCTAVQISLVCVLAERGIHPSSVVGHSSGEIAAAYASGALTVDEAIIAAYYRGQITREVKKEGAMAAIGLGQERALKYLSHRNDVVVACENSPESVTISGDSGAVADVMADIKTDNPDCFVRQLKVRIAYHSEHMKSIGHRYRVKIQKYVTGQSPKVPFYSTVSGTDPSSSVMGPNYWQANLESPVLFSSAVIRLLQGESQPQLFLEVGPHSALGGPLRQIFKISPSVKPSYVPTILREEHSQNCLLECLGQLYIHGVSVDFGRLFAAQTVKGLTDLPPYPWHYGDVFWDESRISRGWRLRKFPHHDILGSRVMESSDICPTWRNVLHLDDVPWIKDHNLDHDIIFPVAGYIAMVGEAARQLHWGEGECPGFSLRHVVVNAALLLEESKPTEIITCLRPHRLTDSVDSLWFDFTVTSFKGKTWTKHCVGQVKSGTANNNAICSRSQTYPRAVPAPSWYATMAKVGLHYGPRFQGLKEISASTHRLAAIGSTANEISSEESTYTLHPTTIDHCLQVSIVAACQGIGRRLIRLCVPVRIDEMAIISTASTLTMESEMRLNPEAAQVSDALCYGRDGRPVLTIRGLHVSPLNDGASRKVNEESNLITWQPDVDFLDPGSLIVPPKDDKMYIILGEKLLAACIIECDIELGDIEGALPHLQRFRSWIRTQVDLIRKDSWQLLEDAEGLLNLSSEDRRRLIDSLAEVFLKSPKAPLVVICLRILRNCTKILQNETDALALLLEENSLVDLYNSSGHFDLTPYLKLLGHSKPNMRVIEIGAGTGGTTQRMLQGLRSPSDEPLYSLYSYTDISAGFFAAAQERFCDASNVKYSVLDISKDPRDQGFEPHSYDLVVATNVLHATPCLSRTLENVKSLLHPEGRLLLQETCTVSRVPGYIFGILPGWWLGVEDGRSEAPYLSPEIWTQVLSASGFDAPQAVVYDNEKPYHYEALMVVKPTQNYSPPRRVTILTGELTSSTCTQRDIATAFEQHHYRVDFCSINDDLPPTQDVLCLLDEKQPFFHESSEESFIAFKRLIETVKSSRLLWVTKTIHHGQCNPRYSLVLGLARTLRGELEMDFATLEVDTFDAQVIFNVFQKFQNRRDRPILEKDFEFSLNKGILRIPRFFRESVNGRLLQTPSAADMKHLEVGTPGMLQTLQWTERRYPRALGDEDVEVEVKAAGMNFRDILIGMGIIKADMAQGATGAEGSGVIKRVGRSVQNVSVGDRVFLLTFGTWFSTSVVIPAQACAKMPRNLDFESAATIPIVFMTAIYSLLHHGQLKKGDSVLIHSACGGVGLAAIQICKMMNAEIYATVGTEEKVKFLVEAHDIPRERIFNSRDSSFASEVMRKTDGRGVDLVLNSLSGELLHHSWACVAKYGKMIELGKRDFIGHADLAMKPFLNNRSFIGVDIAGLFKERLALGNQLLEECVRYYSLGLIQPIQPLKVFQASNVVECFKYMQKGLHIGKIVMSMPETSAELPAKPTKFSVDFDPNSSYLLSGGLGGIGRTVCTWMVERGARHLIVLSPSAGRRSEDKLFLKELESQGCAVHAIQGSVSVMADVKRAIESSSEFPIKGVMNMPMFLMDQYLNEMTYQQWNEVLAPKVQGTWNLHNALGSTDLDFFVLFGSVAGILGVVGQSNYAAANAFVDSFVCFRHGLGLPASVLNFSSIAGVGWVSRNPSVQRRLKNSGLSSLEEQDLLDGVQLAIANCRPDPKNVEAREQALTNGGQVNLGLRPTKPVEDIKSGSSARYDIRASIFRNNTRDDAATTGAQSGHEVKNFMIQVTTDPSILESPENVAFIARQIGLHLNHLLMKSDEDLDTSVPFTAIGVDSLTAIEMRTWLRQAFELDISVLDIVGAGSVDQLALKVVERLKERYGHVVEDVADSVR